MSDERDPAGDPQQLGQHGQPDHGAPEPGITDHGLPQDGGDPTGPVTFDHTQELSTPVPPAPPAMPVQGHPGEGPAPFGPYSAEPTPYGTEPSPFGTEPSPFGTEPPPYGTEPPPFGAQPGAYGAPAGPYAGPPVPWGVAPGPPPSGPTGQRRGPGWGATIAIAAIAALFAALVGGLFGGWVEATHQVDLAGGASTIPTAGAGATARPSGSIASIAAMSLPSVVTIKVSGADGTGTGSGFVIDHAGHILTNNHVVAGAASGGSIVVELSNGSQIHATIAGRDGSYDLAVLNTGRTDLKPLTMGSSKDVVVGDQVIAVGAPLGLESSVTSGIVSALNRPVSPGGNGDQQSFINAIQTDAAINPGNSGGPLLDMKGHVVGVNSAIARVPGTTDTQSGNIGVGFSIPSDQAVKTAEQLIRTGKAVHPVIGVVLDRQYTGAGVRILSQATAASGAPVDPNGPAGKAGVKPGDVIVEFDGRPVNDPDNLVVAIRAKNVGDHVAMKVRRGGRTITVNLTLTGTSGG